jgi:hypothetical protein
MEIDLLGHLGATIKTFRDVGNSTDDGNVVALVSPLFAAGQGGNAAIFSGTAFKERAAAFQKTCRVKGWSTTLKL